MPSAGSLKYIGVQASQYYFHRPHARGALWPPMLYKRDSDDDEDDDDNDCHVCTSVRMSSFTAVFVSLPAKVRYECPILRPCCEYFLTAMLESASVCPEVYNSYTYAFIRPECLHLHSRR